MENSQVISIEKTKERIGSIDIAKGLAIFAVCWIHIARNSIPLAIKVFFSYIMGTFFMISAYFYKPNQGYFKNVLKRIKQIVIPMAKYSALVLLLFYLFLLIRGEDMSGANSFSKLLSTFKDVFYDAYSMRKVGEDVGGENSYAIITGVFWFLNRLFFSELIFFALADWTIKSIKRLIPVVLGLVSATFLVQQFIGYHLPFQLEVCCAIAGIMLIASYAKQKNLIKYISERYKTILFWVIVVVAIGCYLALLPLESFGDSLYFGIFSTKKNLQAWRVVPWFATTVIGTYLFIVACSFLDKIPILSSVIKWAGRHSLVILCFHMLVGEILLNLCGHPNIVSILFSGNEHLDYLAGGSAFVRFLIMLATFLFCCLLAFLIDLINNAIKNRKK